MGYETNGHIFSHNSAIHLGIEPKAGAYGSWAKALQLKRQENPE